MKTQTQVIKKIHKSEIYEDLCQNCGEVEWKMIKEDPSDFDSEILFQCQNCGHIKAIYCTYENEDYDIEK